MSPKKNWDPGNRKMAFPEASKKSPVAWTDMDSVWEASWNFLEYLGGVPSSRNSPKSLPVAQRRRCRPPAPGQAAPAIWCSMVWYGEVPIPQNLITAVRSEPPSGHFNWFWPRFQHHGGDQLRLEDNMTWECNLATSRGKITINHWG